MQKNIFTRLKSTYLKKIIVLQNLLRAHWTYQRKVAHCNYPPIYLWIEPTNACNLRCRMCTHSLPEEIQPEKGYMNFDLFKKIIDETNSFVWEISLFLGGESLLHKDIIKMIKYAKSKNLRTRLHTNATLINQCKSRKLINSGLNVISFSFDGYTKEKYEKIRVNANFEDTLNNITNFLSLKTETKVKEPYTILQCLDLVEPHQQCQNNQNIESFLEEFKYFPPDEFRIVRVHNWAGAISQIESQLLDTIYNPCRFIWFAMAITWDGTVVPCCDDLLHRYKIGNVKDNDIMSLWNNNKMLFLRKEIANGRHQNIKLCENCNRLWLPRKSPQSTIPYGDIALRVLLGHKNVGKIKKLLSDSNTIFSG